MLPEETIRWLNEYLQDPCEEMVSGYYDAEEPSGFFFSRLQNGVIRYRMGCRPDSEVEQLFSPVSHGLWHF